MKIFAEKYFELFTDPPKNILEIGSRDGDDAHFLKEYFNTSYDKVFLVEPHPLSAYRIRLKYPQYKLFEVAISEKFGVVDFNAIITNSIDGIGTSSLLKHNHEITMFYYPDNTNSNDNIDNWIKVLSITGEMLFQLIGEKIYDVVKIDVEGVTFQVLISFGNEIKKIKYLHMEVEETPIWRNQILRETINCYMIDMGFVPYIIYMCDGKELKNFGNELQANVIYYNKSMYENKC